jgi:hypothetical protein
MSLLKTVTIRERISRTNISGFEGLKDGGSRRLEEAMKLIRSLRTTGTLRIDLCNGSINGLSLEEKVRDEVIPG